MQTETIKALLTVFAEVARLDGLTVMGGCCAFAAVVGHKLEQLGIPVRGVVASGDAHFRALAMQPGGVQLHREGQVASDVGPIDKIRPANNHSVQAWEATGLNFWHVGLEIELDGKLWLYDRAGAVERKPGTCLPALRGVALVEGHLTVEELNALADDPGMWAPTFDQKKMLPALRALADQMLGPEERAGEWPQFKRPGQTPRNAVPSRAGNGALACAETRKVCN